MRNSSKIRILVVDDEPLARKALKEALEVRGYEVTAIGSGEEAEELLLENSARFDFALIDHVLHPGMLEEGKKEKMNGIETASRIASINRDIGIIGFSGKAEIAEDDQREAIRKGVHRYVYREGGVATLDAIEKYISEMTELRNLRENFGQFFKDRQAMGSLLADLDVGVTLIDRNYHVWYVNDKEREIVGKDELIGSWCYSLFHGYKGGPCKGCAVKLAIERGNTNAKYFFSPVHEGKLKYMYIRAQPVYDQDQKTVIAAMESVIDLTDSQIISEMGAREHLKLILEAIDERGHNEGRGYNRVRVYRATGPYSLKGYMHTGDLPTIFDDSFEISDVREHQCKSHALVSREARFWKAGGTGEDPDADVLAKKDVWIEFPLLDDKGELLGWLAVDNGEGELPLNESDIAVLQSYADEVRKVLKDKVLSEGLVSQEHERMIHIEDIKLKVSAARTPKEALQIIVDDVVEVTDSDMAHIRIKEDSKGVLTVYRGQYAKHALPSIDIDHPQSADARVIRSGKHYIVKDTSQVPHESIFSTPEDAPIVKKIKSCAFFPLEFERENLGVMVIQSFRKDHFDVEKIAVGRELARIAALAIRDYKLIQEKEQVDKMEMELGIASRTIHNIRTPAGALRNYLTVLEQYLKHERDFSEEEALDILARTKTQLERIEKQAGDIQRLLKPLSLRQQAVKIDTLLHQTVGNLLTPYSDVSVNYNLNQPDTQVNVDVDSIKEVFEELISNAVKTMKEETNKTISLTTRLATTEDFTKFNFASNEEYICIDFADTGSGVPAEIKNKIFEPWEAARPDATGLGLAIVKKIIEEHGGGVWLAETNSAGSRFSIVLPIYEGGDKNG